MNTTLYTVAIWLIPLIIAIVFHEVAHGYVARMLGDQTAAERGRLTLNPIRHVDPVGTLLVPMMLALANAPIFGWAKPVPVVTARLNHPRRDMALVALAGPGINLVMAIVAAAALGLWNLWGGGLPQVGGGRFAVDNLASFLRINVFLAIFNLLPVPPFDGGHVIEALLPRPLAAQYGKLSRFGFPVMLFLLVILPMLLPGANVVARVVGPIVYGVRGALLSLFGLV